jgi:putative ABC transport system ATP-binding protein
LDEPTAALDPRTATVVLQLADRLIREFNLTALMITHQLKDAVTYGDRVLVLSEGRAVADLDRSLHKDLQVSDLLKWFGA